MNKKAQNRGSVLFSCGDEWERKSSLKVYKNAEFVEGYLL